MLMIDAMTLSLVPDPSTARPVRVAVVDPNGGDEITGTVTQELSATHVRLRCDDGLVFAVEKKSLRILPID
ncbi:hypothetical protein VP06_17630 [Methylobacterium aquaticum]|jgi:hypothetical protein|uniref:Uncharacterized protein n=2 Tax=Methylobacterium aquaticum TaxID=270351 RepID=A0A0J6SFM5_9HYPH|nr:hypothetical protein VP06_17630 [Methylobacterium aquaticum]